MRGGVGIEDERGREGGAGGGRGAGNRIKIQVLLSSEKNMPEQTFFFFLNPPTLITRLASSEGLGHL